jgi:hydrogenase maturation protein HypF
MQVLRQGKGIVPLEIELRDNTDALIALGGKNITSLGVSVEERSFLLGPMGSIGEDTSLDFFFDSLQDSKKLFDLQPGKLQADLDPQALTARYALSTGMEVQQVEHDLAHVMGGISSGFEISHVMGLCFDEGIGRDQQGVLSGGECLWLDGTEWQRMVQFESFWLPGGESSSSDNRACLFGMLYETFGNVMWEALPLKLRAQLNLQEIERWDRVFDQKLQCRQTRSVTQWWFGLAALLLGTNRNRYQGDTFSALEAAMDRDIDSNRSVKPYPYTIYQKSGSNIENAFNWKPMLREIVTDMQQGRHVQYILRRVFHTFSQWVLRFAAILHPKCIVLSGSAFENRVWTEHLIETLKQHGFKTQLPHRIPMNDSGLAIGQLLATSRGMNARPTEIRFVSEAISKITQNSTYKNQAKESDSAAT